MRKSIENNLSDLVSDYSKVREHLMIRVYSDMTMRGTPEAAPHKRKAGLILTSCMFYVTPDGQLITSWPITYDQMKDYGISAEQLWEDTLRCCLKEFPVRIDFLDRLTEDTVAIHEDIPQQKKILVVTNTHSVGGASAFFYPGVMEDIAQRLGESYYVIPSSMHEMIVIAESIAGCIPLTKMLREINRDVVEIKDILADFVLHYDAKTGELERAPEDR